MPSAAAASAEPEPAAEPRWATLRQASEYSRGTVSVRRLRDWIYAGLLPATRLGPKIYQIDLNDLDALRQTVPSAATVPLDSSDVPEQTAGDQRVKSRQSAFERAGNG